MKTIRIVFACLLIIPLGLGINSLVNPGDYWPKNSTTGEMLFLIFGLPILMLNMWAWDAPEIIEGLFFWEPDSKGDPTHVICTYCSARKDQTEGMLPASARYISERISHVQEVARQSEQRFCILSGEFGLLESDQPIPWYDHLLIPEEVPALVEKVAAQLVEKKIAQVDYYTRSLEVDPNSAPYTNTLEAACTKAGTALNIHVLE